MNPVKPTILFRLEGNDLVGYGHFFRCLTIARNLKEEFKCVMSMSSASDWAMSQLSKEEITLIALSPLRQLHPDDADAASELPYDLDGIANLADIVVLDGYRFGIEYRQQLQDVGVKVVQIFDEVDFDADVDGYITPLILTDAERRRLQSGCQVFDGSNGFLIRPEFYLSHRNPVVPGPRTFVYATQEEAMAFYKGLQKLAGTDVVALTNDRFKDDCLQLGWDVVLHADAEEVTEAMMACDTALLPASSVALEYLVVRGRAPYVFVTAENQREGFTRMLDSRLWRDAGRLISGRAERGGSGLSLVNPVIGLRRWMNDLWKHESS